MVTGERRYDEDEVRRIFDEAAGPGGSAASGRDPGGDAHGMTLAELQDIGTEVGLSPERIARVAATLDAPSATLPRKRQLGMPVSVGHVVELPRAPTDREWDLLVSALRETFGARGKISQHGGIREWTNGNLHAYVEPTEGGHRLRLGTLNGGALALNFGGVVSASLGIAISIALTMAGRFAEDGPALLSMLVVFAAIAFLGNAVRLPRWADERENQMQEIAARALALLDQPPSEHHELASKDD